MNFPSLSGVQQRIKRLKNSLKPKALILLYHRVVDVESDPQLMCVEPRRFAQHLEHLARRFTVLGLQELGEIQTRAASIPDRTVVITFDDGYADNVVHARPLLTQFHLPATFFVTTSFLAQDREFWWDELERIFLRPSTLPSMLRLNVKDRVYECELGTAAAYGENEYERDRRWTVLDRENPTARHAVYRDLCALLRPISEEDRRSVLEELRKWSGAGVVVRDTHHCMTAAQVKELASSALMDVGAHTMSHSVLAKLPECAQRAEISESRDHLGRILGNHPRSFAYPFGTKSDYTQQTAALVREAGFTVACSNCPDVVTNGEDVFQLPRVIVRDWDRDQFARSLDDWFAGRFQSC